MWKYAEVVDRQKVDNSNNNNTKDDSRNQISELTSSGFESSTLIKMN